MIGVINPLQAHACNCIGPQGGDPVCPCAMPAYRRRQMGEKAIDTLLEMSDRITKKNARIAELEALITRAAEVAEEMAGAIRLLGGPWKNEPDMAGVKALLADLRAALEGEK